MNNIINRVLRFKGCRESVLVMLLDAIKTNIWDWVQLSFQFVC